VRNALDVEAVSKPGLGATAGLPSSEKLDNALLDEPAVAPDVGSISDLKLLHPEQIIKKLRDAGAMLNGGKDQAAVLQTLEVSEATYLR
jgi:hypothetical protein